jgi:hypothetical protein
VGLFIGGSGMPEPNKVMTVGELREFLAYIDADVEVYVNVKMNDEDGYFPLEDIKPDTEPVLLLCGEECIMLIEDKEGA